MRSQRTALTNRGSTLAVFVWMLPATLGLVLLTLTHLTQANRQTALDGKRAQAQHLAESALTVYGQSPARAPFGKPGALLLSGSIDSVGDYRLTVERVNADGSARLQAAGALKSGAWSVESVIKVHAPAPSAEGALRILSRANDARPIEPQG